jgi:hypothetical protein
MRTKNPHFRFVVITDDITTAKKFFPNFEVLHFNIGLDYAIVQNAHYLILSNSSFAFFPAWLSTNLKFCIAPKYWSQYNESDGYWGLGYNITSGWMYQDRSGKLQTYEECLADCEAYKAGKRDLLPPLYEKKIFFLWRRNMERKAKKAWKILSKKVGARLS